MPLSLRTQLGVLDTELVADLLDCEVTTVQARALAGDLPGIKIGRSWVFPREALMQQLNATALEEAAQRRASKAPAPTAVAVAVPARRGRRSVLPACLMQPGDGLRIEGERRVDDEPV